MSSDFTLDGRYADVGYMTSAVTAAQTAGALRKFRVKFQPARCACCGKPLRTGEQVVSPERGRLVGRCCWWE